MDNRDEYSYGWNQKGQRFHALKSGRREGRINIIAALCNQKLIAPFTVEAHIPQVRSPDRVFLKDEQNRSV